MADHATSSHAAVQAQLDRLWALSPGADVLGLDRIARLLDRIGNPHRALPPVFHVAGTNGKGSTCAFLRAALEAGGYRVHAYTSPHLVRFNERIRLAGGLIDDDTLALLLAEVLDAGGDIGASFFEVTTAAAFLAFARTPADACVIEVGLGGRLDATNVLPAPVACGIAALGIDHQSFLGDTIEGIAAEKAGIAKAGVPLVTMAYPPTGEQPIAHAAARAGAPLVRAGREWQHDRAGASIVYRDHAGEITLPLPALAGTHQADNLALAAAMLRHQTALPVSDAALIAAADNARWPARLQRLSSGRLTALLPPNVPVWLDGGHNPNAGEAIAASLDPVIPASRRSLVVVMGMLANKDPAGFLAPFAERIDHLIGVPVSGHEHHAPAALAGLARAIGIPAATTAHSVAEALAGIAPTLDPDARPSVLIVGSLYLAGTVLAANDEAPD